MFVGHFFLAFVLAAGFFQWKGESKTDSLMLGLFAGFFAVLPDLDIIYAFKTFIQFALAPEFMEAFWENSQVIHRGISHSLVTGFIAATLFSLGYEKNSLIGNIFSSIFLGVFAFIVSGWIGAFVMALYGIVGGFLSSKAEEYISRKKLYGVSLLGLLTHPFGDLFTGSPPQLLYPLKLELIPSRLAIFAEPTLNLVTLVIIELVLVASGLYLINLLKDIKFQIKNPSITTAITYALTALVISPPSIQNPYIYLVTLFSFSLLITIANTVLNSKKSYLTDLLFFVLVSIIGSVSYFVMFGLTLI